MGNRIQQHLVKLTPVISVGQVEAANVASRRSFHQNLVKEYSLFCGLACTQVEPVRMMP